MIAENSSRRVPHEQTALVAAAQLLLYPSCVQNRKTVQEMFGEFCREAAVLTAVFIPLDLVILEKPLTLQWVIVILGSSGGLLGLGMACERLRKQEVQ